MPIVRPLKVVCRHPVIKIQCRCYDIFDVLCTLPFSKMSGTQVFWTPRGPVDITVPKGFAPAQKASTQWDRRHRLTVRDAGIPTNYYAQQWAKNTLRELLKNNPKYATPAILRNLWNKKQRKNQNDAQVLALREQVNSINKSLKNLPKLPTQAGQLQYNGQKSGSTYKYTRGPKHLAGSRHSPYGRPTNQRTTNRLAHPNLARNLLMPTGNYIKMRN